VPGKSFQREWWFLKQEQASAGEEALLYVESSEYPAYNKVKKM
jgi:hypothetical protein